MEIKKKILAGILIFVLLAGGITTIIVMLSGSSPDDSTTTKSGGSDDGTSTETGGSDDGTSTETGGSDDSTTTKTGGSDDSTTTKTDGSDDSTTTKTGGSESEPCVPNCSGKNCGPSNCPGKNCGTCNSGSSCNSGVCKLNVQKCVPNCKNKDCGSNGCNGVCGACISGKICNKFGKCVIKEEPQKDCVPNCKGKKCGSNGCGGSCGKCATGFSCNSSNQCIYSSAIRYNTLYRFSLDVPGVKKKQDLFICGNNEEIGGVCYSAGLSTNIVGQEREIESDGFNFKFIKYKYIQSTDYMRKGDKFYIQANGGKPMADTIIYMMACGNVPTSVCNSIYKQYNVSGMYATENAALLGLSEYTLWSLYTPNVADGTILSTDNKFLLRYAKEPNMTLQLCGWRVNCGYNAQVDEVIKSPNLSISKV